MELIKQGFYSQKVSLKIFKFVSDIFKPFILHLAPPEESS